MRHYTMNICFFTKYELTWGSSRERIGNYLPFLKKSGHRYRVISLIPNQLSQMWIGKKDSPWLIRKGASFLYIRILRYIKCCLLILISKNFDAIVIQKINFPFILLKILKIRNKNIIFDFDDLCFKPTDSGKITLYEKMRQRWNLYQDPKVLGLFKHVIAGNSYLASLAFTSTPQPRVTILPTPIDTTLYHPTPHRKVPSSPITLGWIGSGENHYPHLKLLIKPLEVIGQKYPIRFVLVGAMHSKKIKQLFLSAHYEFVCIDWLDAKNLAQTIRSFDIGLMPLADNTQSKGKCGFKALAYMASGITTIVSPIGINTEIIQDGKNGFWAKNEEEWIEKISRLIGDEKLRYQLSQEGQNTIKQGYTLTKTAQGFINILERTHESRS